MTPEERAQIDRALPGYEIGNELGRGAFGVVLSGRHQRLDREVAIKQLPAVFSADPNVRARFLAEAQVLATLTHPHVIPIYDYVEDGDLCLLVMEKLTGGTLWSRFTEQGLTPQSACGALIATCAGLDHAHAKGVLHRDIKPENLLFSTDGVLKVADFGIAKVLTGSQAMATRAGDVLGTPAYMAPEQARGTEVTPATDVYACGIMLYELLSGRLPFSEEGGALAIVYRHVNEDPIPLATAAPSVPPALAEVVMTAIAREPADRYASAEAFAVALGETATDTWGMEWLEAADLPVLATGTIMSRATRPSSRAAAGPALPGSTVGGSQPPPTVAPGSPAATPTVAPGPETIAPHAAAGSETMAPHPAAGSETIAPSQGAPAVPGAPGAPGSPPSPTATPPVPGAPPPVPGAGGPGAPGSVPPPPGGAAASGQPAGADPSATSIPAAPATPTQPVPTVPHEPTMRVRPAVTRHVQAADFTELEPEDLVPVQEVLSPPAFPIVQLLVALALLLGAVAIAFLGPEADPAPRPDPGVMSLAGVDPASGLLPELNLDGEIPLATTTSADRVELNLSLAGIPLGTTAQSEISDGISSLTLGSARYTTASVVDADVRLLSGDVEVVAMQFPVRMAHNPWLTVPAGLVVLLAMFAASYVESSLRHLRKGRRKVGSLASLLVSGAALGVAFVGFAWLTQERIPTLTNLITVAVLAGLAGLAAGFAALRARRRRMLMIRVR